VVVEKQKRTNEAFAANRLTAKLVQEKQKTGSSLFTIDRD
jgi:hypothetical protein